MPPSVMVAGKGSASPMNLSIAGLYRTGPANMDFIIISDGLLVSVACVVDNRVRYHSFLPERASRTIDFCVPVRLVGGLIPTAPILERDPCGF
ncbi:unnamed protein product [Fusarium graminearum]|uniref:Uncharacterized protein n=1 Tax=Gibberella zeae TaxID=5518 RepID=A0A4E9EIG6_GIBZA|nr:unnamed protein product [Fusarium graminearum]CAG1997203.1 unnamed protein product [Fusarium graminearum]